MSEMDMDSTDDEILEGWLDGELDDQACDALRLRVSRDPQLAARIDWLRSERAHREMFWKWCEPSNGMSEQCAANIRATVMRGQLVADRYRLFRNAAAIAATFALVFSSGWMSHSRMGGLQTADLVDVSVPRTSIPQMDLPGRSVAPVSSAGFNPNNYSLSMGNASMVNWPVDSNGMSRVRPVYRLVLIDPAGTAIATQTVEDVNNPDKLSAGLSAFESRLGSSRGSAALVSAPAPVH